MADPATGSHEMTVTLILLGTLFLTACGILLYAEIRAICNLKDSDE